MSTALQALATPIAVQITSVPAPFDVYRVRADFPLLRRYVRDKPLVYLDNAATSQKPRVVIDALDHYYASQNANIHRGVHYLSQEATEAYEAARRRVRHFINAEREQEVIFVRGATEGINLVAQTYGRQHVGEGDEILVSAMEHHSNIVPWQMLCEERGAVLRVIPMNDRGELLMDAYERMLTERTKLVSVVHISNALGTVNPVGEMVQLAHSHGIPVLVDGAQSAPHVPVNVRELDCDFFVFSGHKVFAPTGIGVLYGKSELLESMPPYQGGGEMILSVSFEKTVYSGLPNKFEAGTPNIAGGIGLGAALDYLEQIGFEETAGYEAGLLQYAHGALAEVDGLRMIGTAEDKAGILSFVLDDIHPHDIGTVLDQEGIAIRTGHHCAQPVMQRFGVPATARASTAFYNTRDDIDALVRGLHQTIEVFR